MDDMVKRKPDKRKRRHKAVLILPPDLVGKKEAREVLNVRGRKTPAAILEARLKAREGLLRQLQNKARGSRLVFRSVDNLLSRARDFAALYASEDEVRRRLHQLEQRGRRGDWSEIEREKMTAFISPSLRRGVGSMVGAVAGAVGRVGGSALRVVEFENLTRVSTNNERYLLPLDLWREIRGRRHNLSMRLLCAVVREVEANTLSTHNHPSVNFVEAVGFNAKMIKRAVKLRRVWRWRVIFRQTLSHKIKRGSFYGLTCGGSHVRYDLRTSEALEQFKRQIKRDMYEVKRISRGEFTDINADVGTVGYFD